MTTPIQPSEGIALLAYDQKLDTVVEILSGLKSGLNVHVSTCAGCGQERRSDWQQFLAYEALQGALTRVQKAASLIGLSLAPQPPAPPVNE